MSNNILRIFAIVLITSLTSVSTSATAARLREVALVVGNSDYQTVHKLRNPGNDADLIAQKLKEVGFTVFGGGAEKDLDRHSMNTILNNFFVSSQNADVVLVYYAGHGVQVNGENYLIPIDADPQSESDVPPASISATNILKGLASAHTRLGFLILDACRDNPFADRNLFRTLAGPPRGLATMTAEPGTMIWYATSPGSKSQDGAGRNGPYAEAIARYINQKNLDIYSFFNRSGLDVMNSTGNSQNPWLAASAMGGTFYFVGPGGQAEFRDYNEVQERSLGEPDLAAALFRSGLEVPGRSFRFGQTYEQINRLLDSSFRIETWDSLPRAGEYRNDDVRYFWVPLSSLPVVQSALAGLALDQKCIDAGSHIVFFFKNGTFFHTSIRLLRTPSCLDYDWLRSSLFSDGTKASYSDGINTTDLVWHRGAYYDILEVTRRGIADDVASVFVDS